MFYTIYKITKSQILSWDPNTAPPKAQKSLLYNDSLFSTCRW